MTINLRRRMAQLPVLALTLSSLGLSQTLAQGAFPSVADPQYLTFQLFTAGPGMTTEGGTQVISRLPDRGFIDTEAKAILDTIGERGDPLHRLGIMVGPLALDYTDDQMRELIRRTFAVAEERRIAVGIHIDESKFWRRRADLWRNPSNVEWLDWRGSGNTGQYLNWGEPWKIAPQICFNSPVVVNEGRRIARDVIGPAVAQGVARLRSLGDEGLFAGLIVGWETAIGKDYDTGRNLGFCALKNLGYSQNSPPRDLDATLETVVPTWIDNWAQALSEAGVPQNRIYSHIAFAPRRQFDSTRDAKGGSYSSSVLYTPPRAAFGAKYRPGFSTYPSAGLFEEIGTALSEHGNPPWASAEGANVDIRSAPPRIPSETMEDYLARMFNHGAAITNVFGWNVESNPQNLFRKAAESPESIQAYKKFLRGERLVEKPLSQSYVDDPSAVQSLIHALPERIKSFLRAGGAMNLIQPQVAELDKSVKQGNLAAIKKNLSRIEAMIDAQIANSSKQGFDIDALQSAVRALPEKISAYQQKHGDMNRIRDRVASLQRRLDAGELQQAFQEVKALEPILSSP